MSTIDITVQTVDLTGSPKSVGYLLGCVTNRDGILVDELSINDLTEGPVGTYTLEGYDVSDYHKFPGSSLQIVWCLGNTWGANSAIVSSVQDYAIQGAHQLPYKHRIVYWEPSYNPKLYGYQVVSLQMSPSYTISYVDSHGDPVPEGYVLIDGELKSIWAPATWGIGDIEHRQVTTDNFYVDTRVYESMVEAQSQVFLVFELVWGANGEPTHGIQRHRVTIDHLVDDFCIVRGNVRLVSGSASPLQQLLFKSSVSDPVQTLSNTWFIDYNTKSAPIHPSGMFAVPLVQGLDVTLEIPETSINRRFIVPNSSVAQITDIPMTSVRDRKGYWR